MRALCLAAIVACGSPSPPPTPMPAPEPVVTTAAPLPRIVAHRGASYAAPENTLAAFTRAWELGVECVELDVHVTRDGEVVVIHDDNTRRVGRRDRAVADQTLAELRELDVGRWKGAAFAGERIPTLAEALATIPHGRTMFVEIKSPAATAKTVARAILAADPRPRGGAVALQAFDPDTLAALAAELPGVPAYWTANPPLDDRDRPLRYPREVAAEAVRRGFAGLALYHASATPELLADARAAGLLVDVWTINDAPTIARWLAGDVRWVETDRPDLVPR